ncbi:MAG TPA: hypothetical protein VKS60_12910 [Stellaceae bacterium]|nr:hypothetical protein [Stellaceae bacterium]
MIMRTNALLAFFVLAAAGAAQAETVKPVAAQPINLGGVTGIAYYTVEPNGYRVVATLGARDEATAVRLDVTLGEGQSVVLSSPRGVGETAETVTLAREAGRIVVYEQGAAVTN